MLDADDHNQNEFDIEMNQDMVRKKRKFRV